MFTVYLFCFHTFVLIILISACFIQFGFNMEAYFKFVILVACTRKTDLSLFVYQSIVLRCHQDIFFVY